MDTTPASPGLANSFMLGNLAVVFDPVQLSPPVHYRVSVF
jgi:hypothetical protein